MSLCPVCGRPICGEHTLAERGQIYAEAVRPLSPEEEKFWRKENDEARIIEFARHHAHDKIMRKDDQAAEAEAQ